MVFTMLGIPTIDLHAMKENKVSRILLLGGAHPRLPLQCFLLQLAVHSAVLFPYYRSPSPGHCQAQSGQSQTHPDCCCVAEATLVLGPPLSVSSASHVASSPSQSAHIRPWLHPTSSDQLPALYGVASWLNEEEGHCLEALQQVILNRIKSSIRTSYLSKWKRISMCSLACGSHLAEASIQDTWE